jgi:hypothetical protein
VEIFSLHSQKSLSDSSGRGYISLLHLSCGSLHFTAPARSMAKQKNIVLAGVPRVEHVEGTSMNVV